METVLYQFLTEVPQAAAIWSALLLLALTVLTVLVARPERDRPAAEQSPAPTARELAAAEAADLRRYADEVAVAAAGAAQTARRRRDALAGRAGARPTGPGRAYDEAETRRPPVRRRRRAAHPAHARAPRRSTPPGSATCTARRWRRTGAATCPMRQLSRRVRPPQRLGSRAGTRSSRRCVLAPGGPRRQAGRLPGRRRAGAVGLAGRRTGRRGGPHARRGGVRGGGPAAAEPRCRSAGAAAAAPSRRPRRAGARPGVG